MCVTGSACSYSQRTHFKIKRTAQKRFRCQNNPLLDKNWNEIKTVLINYNTFFLQTNTY